MSLKASFWWWWLVVVTAALLLIGLAMVVLPSPTQQLYNLLYFGSPGGNPAFQPAASYLEFAFAALGAIMIGWAVTLLFILAGPFRHVARQAWLTFVVAVTAWFIPDTAFSLLSGFWQNAVLNTVIALLFAIPLVATYRGLSDT